MSDNEICVPLTTIEEVLIYNLKTVNSKNPITKFYSSFVIKNSFYDCHQESFTINPRQRLDPATVPKTIVCHDYKGGYVEDKYKNGCNIGNGYSFYRWSNIDIFIYFSHHLVTVPPVGWIKCAHQNNVKILGTFITEWTDGKKICDDILQTEDTYKNFANALVKICVAHNFDGYLLNIENKITNTGMLINFIKYLREELRKVDEEYIVLWYDSVTVNGDLKWQNELNHLNKVYFDICDGIFLNYTWKEDNLKNSLTTAGQRYLDVYVGVDIFGRNCYGGGGFFSHMAAEKIRKYNLSMAIFAQGWTHETLDVSNKDHFFDMFLRRDNVFWLKIHPYLYTRPIQTKNINTSFYIGADKKKYNLNLQQLSLSRPGHCGKHDSTFNKYLEYCDCIQIYNQGYQSDSFSYKLTNYKLDKDKNHILKLFVCDINAVGELSISTCTKKFADENASLDIVILAMDESGIYYNIYGSRNRRSEKIKYSSLVPHFGNTEFKIKVDAEEQEHNWKITKYLIRLPVPVRLLEIGAIVNGGSIILGQIQINT